MQVGGREGDRPESATEKGRMATRRTGVLKADRDEASHRWGTVSRWWPLWNPLVVGRLRTTGGRGDILEEVLLGGLP
jgi:hypothetical protein